MASYSLSWMNVLGPSGISFVIRSKPEPMLRSVNFQDRTRGLRKLSDYIRKVQNPFARD